MTTPLDPEFDIDPELAALLADPSMWDEPSDSLADRVRAAVRNEVEHARGLESEPQVAPVVPLQQTSSVRLRQKHLQQKSPIHKRAAGMRWMAIAAAVVLGIGAFGLARRSPSGVPSVIVALAATDLLPDATGSVEITQTESGLKIELDATGLPRRDGRLFYQAWLKGEAGLVPIGSFHSGQDVTLWAGVALKDFPAITITEEEVGDQDSSGRRVLVGTSVVPS